MKNVITERCLHFLSNVTVDGASRQIPAHDGTLGWSKSGLQEKLLPALCCHWCPLQGQTWNQTAIKYANDCTWLGDWDVSGSSGSRCHRQGFRGQIAWQLVQTQANQRVLWRDILASEPSKRDVCDVIIWSNFSVYSTIKYIWLSMCLNKLWKNTQRVQVYSHDGSVEMPGVCGNYRFSNRSRSVDLWSSLLRDVTRLSEAKIGL